MTIHLRVAWVTLRILIRVICLLRCWGLSIWLVHLTVLVCSWLGVFLVHLTILISLYTILWLSITWRWMLELWIFLRIYWSVCKFHLIVVIVVITKLKDSWWFVVIISLLIVIVITFKKVGVFNINVRSNNHNQNKNN